jgi:hypothetical protein
MSLVLGPSTRATLQNQTQLQTSSLTATQRQLDQLKQLIVGLARQIGFEQLGFLRQW